MMSKKRLQFGVVCAFVILVSAAYGADDPLEEIRIAIDRTEIRNDIFVVLGMPNEELRPLLSDFFIERNLIVYFQSADSEEVAFFQRAAQQRELFPCRPQFDMARYRSLVVCQ